MTAAQFKQEFLTGYNAISSFGAPGYKDWEISTFLTKAQERIVLKRLNALGNKYRDGVEQTEKRRVDLSLLTTSALLSPAALQNGVTENSVLFSLPANFLYTLNERAIINVDDCTHPDTYLMIFENSTGTNNNVRVGDIFSYSGTEAFEVTSGANNLVYVTLTGSRAPVAGDVMTNQNGISFTIKDILTAKYIANVKPITHDAYNANRNNPFKQPYEQLLWRMDFGGVDIPPFHEIVGSDTIYPLYYILRYYRKPRPIIVGNLGTRSIEGLSAVTECELHSIVHREIIDEAIMIADADAEAKKIQINAIETQKSE